MKHILIILSILLLHSPLFGQSERPETIIIPVSSMGDVSEIRKQKKYDIWYLSGNTIMNSGAFDSEGYASSLDDLICTKE